MNGFSLLNRCSQQSKYSEGDEVNEHWEYNDGGDILIYQCRILKSRDRYLSTKFFYPYPFNSTISGSKNFG